MGDLAAQLTFWTSSRNGFMLGGSDVVVCGATNRAVVIDGAGMVITHWDARSSGGVSDSALSENKLVSIVSSSKKIAVVTTCQHKDRAAIACIFETGGILIADARDGSRLAGSHAVLADASPQCAVEVHSRSLACSYILVGDTNSTLTVVNTDTLQAVHRCEVPSPGFTIGMVSHASKLAAVLPDKTLRYWAVREELAPVEPVRTDSPQALVSPTSGAGGSSAGGSFSAPPTRPAMEYRVALEKSSFATLPGKGIPVGVSHHGELPLTLVIAVTCCVVYVDPETSAETPRMLCSVGRTEEGVKDSQVTHVFSKGAFIPSQSGRLTLAAVTSSGMLLLYTVPDFSAAALQEGAAPLGPLSLLAERQLLPDPLCWSLVCLESVTGEGHTLRICGVGYSDDDDDGSSGLRTSSSLRGSVLLGAGGPLESPEGGRARSPYVSRRSAHDPSGQRLLCVDLSEEEGAFRMVSSSEVIADRLEDNMRADGARGWGAGLAGSLRRLSSSRVLPPVDADETYAICADDASFLSSTEDDDDDELIATDDDAQSPHSNTRTDDASLAAPAAAVTFSYLSIPSVQRQGGGKSGLLTLFKGLSTGEVQYETATEEQQLGEGEERGRWQAHRSAVSHILLVGGDLLTCCQDGEMKRWRWGSWLRSSGGNAFLEPESVFLIHTTVPVQIIVANQTLQDRHGIDFWTIGAEGTVAFMDSHAARYTLCGNYTTVDANVDTSYISDSVKAGLTASSRAAPPQPPVLYSSVHYVRSLDFVIVVSANKLSSFVWHLGTETLLRVVKGDKSVALANSLHDTENYVVADSDDVGSSPAGAGGGHSQSPSANVTMTPLEACAYSDRTGFGAAVLRLRVSRLIEGLYPSGEKEKEGAAAKAGASRAYFMRFSKMLLSYLLQGIVHPSVQALRTGLNISVEPFPEGATLSFIDKQRPQGNWMSCPSKRDMSKVVEPSSPSEEEVQSYAFGMSPLTTSKVLVTLLAILHALCKTTESLQPELKAVINYFASEIPQTLRNVPQYFEADFFWCLTMIEDPLRDVQFAARCVLNGTLKLAGPEELKSLIAVLDKATDPVSMLGLAVVATQRPTVLEDKEVASKACDRLINLCLCTTLSTNLHVSVLNHLSDTYGIWAPMLSRGASMSPQNLIRALLNMTTSQAPYEGLPNGPARAAFRGLVSCSLHHLAVFLQYADAVLADVQAPKEDETLPLQNCVLHALSHMIKNQPSLFVPHLLRVALLLLKALDPHFPKVRDKCMATSTQALKAAVEAFPMMSFHQAKQSLAVGDVAGQAVVWDMRTGSKWFVWDAHTAAISCIAISTLGDLMATYSMREGTLKIWSTEMPALSILLSTHKPRLIATLETGTSTLVQSSQETLQNTSLQWISPHNIELTTGPGKKSQVFEF